MAPRILFLYQVAHENGGIFLERAQSRGTVIEKLLTADKITTDDYQADVLVIMGGPMNVDEVEKYPFLKEEVRLIQTFAKNQKPVLGICLGAQLIAKALGGRVTKNRVKEIGWYEFSLTPHGDNDPTLKEMLGLKKIFQWHGDTFSIPLGGKHLVQSSLCSYQAFVFQKNIYALQFHLEVTREMVANWLQNADNLQELKSLGIQPQSIERDTAEHIDALNRVGKEFIDAYFDLALKPAS